MQQLSRLLTAVVIAAVPAAALQAQTVDAITASFQNSVPGTNTSIGTWTNPDPLGPDGTQVCWPTGGAGTCTTLGEATNISGYRFVPTATPFVAPIGTAFSLGTFTHFNYVVSLDSPGPLTSVDLLFSFEIGGATPGVFADNWTISHTETPNDANPCAEGGPQPCRDKVAFSIGGTGPTEFEYGGITYILKLLGFGENAAEALANPDFFTQENQENTTQLWAQITPASTVPEPATMTLLATGLAGMAAARKRRKS